MKPLSGNENSLCLSSINEVMYDINPDIISTNWTQLHHCPPTHVKPVTTCDPQPEPHYYPGPQSYTAK